MIISKGCATRYVLLPAITGNNSIQGLMHYAWAHFVEILMHDTQPISAGGCNASIQMKL